MIIDKEFESLIPPLTEKEYKGLEESILAEGCRDPLICWNDIVVDGHNRYKICTEHNLLFTTIEKEFKDRDEVKLWIMKNQLSRRNLNDFQRIEITHRCEDAVRAIAKERQQSGLRQNQTEGYVPLKPSELRDARDELGKMSGVSGVTYEHGVEVLEKAPEPIVEAARNNEITIHAAYEVTKMPEETQNEVVERIEQGEKTKDVVADVRSRAGVSTKTYERAVKVIEEAPDEIKEAVRKGEITINQAYKQVKKAEKQKEVETEVVSQEIQEPATLRVGSGIGYSPDELYDLLLTDPPYVENIDEFANSWLFNALKYLKPTGSAYVFVGTSPEELRAYLNAEMPYHVELVQVLIWTQKNAFEDSSKSMYKQNYHACLFYRGIEAKELDFGSAKERLAVQDINASSETDKPMELAERFIRHSTKVGDVMFDPFAGTGTFLLAASKLGRKGYGFEIDPENAEKAKKRGVQVEG